MPIVGLNLKSVKAERLERIRGMVKRNNTLNISNFKIEKLQSLGEERELGVIGFEYKTEYDPKVAIFELVGEILYHDNTKELKKLEKDFKKKRALPKNLSENVLNFILVKITPRALELAEDLRIPSPVVLPRLRRE